MEICIHVNNIGLTASVPKYLPLFQFLFGAKVQEVAELREKGSTVKVPLQFARVLRYENKIFIFKERISGLLTIADKISDHNLVIQWLKLSILKNGKCYYQSFNSFSFDD